MTRPKEQDYFIRATYVRQLENYCNELENEVIENLQAERDVLKADAERFRWLRRLRINELRQFRR